LSDVFDKIVERLKQKAKSGFEVVDKSEALGNVPATVCDVAYVCRECTDKDVCPFITEKQWVKLEDVEEAIQQIKQKHVIIEKKKLEDFRCFIRKKAEECLREMETEEGIIREGLEARLGVYDEITLKLEELLRKK